MKTSRLWLFVCIAVAVALTAVDKAAASKSRVAKNLHRDASGGKIGKKPVKVARNQYNSDEYDEYDDDAPNIVNEDEKPVQDGIVNGRPIDIVNAPYQVQLQKDDFTICGGTIISSRWILTAAHCLYRLTGRFAVLTGSHSRDDGKVQNIKNMFIHPEYNAKTHENDIALLELRKDIRFNAQQKPIEFGSAVPSSGDEVFLTGFGTRGTGGVISSYLEAAVTPVVGWLNCQFRYFWSGIFITDGMFCAGNGHTDTCQGDSGGPAVVRGKLVGVVSFGQSCASSFYPGVYTSVPHYLPWIQEVTGLSPSPRSIGRSSDEDYSDEDSSSSAGHSESNHKVVDDKDSGEHIVGGEISSIQKAPYQVQLQENGYTVCGGSIIEREWILTAAHCVKGSSRDDLKVLTGSAIRDLGDVHKVQKIIMHENYNHVTNENDIALIKLTSPINFKKKSQYAIELAEEVPSAGEDVFLTGYGTLGTKKSVSKVLREATTPVKDLEECKKAYKKVRNASVTEKVFCAGNGVTDTCQGDSGGPAVVDGKLAGVVSYGMICGSSIHPGVYTLVPRYRDWIRENTEIPNI